MPVRRAVVGAGASLGILLVHLLFWPVAALAAQASRVLMCQDPCDALGHSTDGHERPGDAYRALGTPYVRFAVRDPR
ncbi:hypothetical protein GCM10010399_42810 [Dactylosporangium fulvum]|uniref:Uncharacterized protein n=1 Tax=Dactylosporangium fulvum TaxID=53359 RepID=A0ABY5W1D5_9ACTN|nr:hypothetical protein [Dactylosporangium fulvum]UWP82859.1 hypothetical protein Dfulv_00635 [Dactylosporangium fulvum]